MKKILYLIMAVGITWTAVSCDNEPKNPGDYSIQSELALGNVVSQSSGTVYNLDVERAIDSIFSSTVTVYDTIWDANGEFLSREGREVVIPSKFTTKYVEFAPITVSAMPDTFSIHITSNAKWICPTPVKYRGSSTFYNVNTGGGGNGTLLFRSEINENMTRKVAADLNIYTSDSTIYYKVKLLQEGLAD